MPLKIVRNDITKMQVDTIVNTANAKPIYSTGVDTAVYEAAGAEELLAARKEIGFLEEGAVAITPGFKLPAKYIIHAVSPCYRGGEQGEEEMLRSCYRNSLALAKENGCKSIAFPLISTGNLGYPKEESLRIGVDEINAFLLWNDMLVYVVVFDAEATRLGQKLYPDLDEYIDRNYVAEKMEAEYKHKETRLFERLTLRRDADRCESRSVDRSAKQSADWYGSRSVGRSADWCENRSTDRSARKGIPGGVTGSVAPGVSRSLNQPEPNLDVPELCILPDETSYLKEPCQVGASVCKEDAADYDDALWEEHESALNERMKHLSDTFQQYLLYLIGQKGLTNAEVYNRAFVTKQVFSKIKLNKEYHPDKATAMRLCVGAKLSMGETKDLLARAGYALSPCDRRDVIFSYFIERGVYDMIDIDIALEEHGLPCFIA